MNETPAQAYTEGRICRRNGGNANQCPYMLKSPKGVRQRWYDGWYDEHFFQKWGSPWKSLNESRARLPRVPE